MPSTIVTTFQVDGKTCCISPVTGEVREIRPYLGEDTPLFQDVSGSEKVIRWVKKPIELLHRNVDGRDEVMDPVTKTWVDEGDLSFGQAQLESKFGSREGWKNLFSQYDPSLLDPP